MSLTDSLKLSNISSIKINVVDRTIVVYDRKGARVMYPLERHGGSYLKWAYSSVVGTLIKALIQLIDNRRSSGPGRNAY